jgi:type IV pilus assembly protein PilW
MAIETRKAQDGYTIVELMVAMTIGLMILATLVTVFANNSRARVEIDRANQQTENGRYALQLLSDELHNAGYFAEFNPGTVSSPDSQLQPNVPTAIPDPCATDVTSLNSNVAVPVQGYDNATAGNIPGCLANVRAGTDILVVRRASTCAVGDAGCDPLVAGAPYFEASTCDTELQQTGTGHFVLDKSTATLTNAVHQIHCTTASGWHQYRTHIYFVANDDKPNDGIPTLKRAELGAGGFTIVPLVEGVENLQIEYGLDTTAPTSGMPAVYTADPGIYNGCAPADCVSYWRNTVAAKIHLLARNNTTTPGYVDDKTYALGLMADGITPKNVGPYNDAFKRHAYEAVVWLTNVSGRNAP